jgi:hypothetical protein
MYKSSAYKKDHPAFLLFSFFLHVLFIYIQNNSMIYVEIDLTFKIFIYDASVKIACHALIEMILFQALPGIRKIV